MNPRTLVPALLAALALAACSSGGSSSGSGVGANNTLPQPGGPASVTLTVVRPQTSGASSTRKAAFVSASTLMATLYVDTTQVSRIACTSTGTCTWVNVPTTAAAHNFRVELDDNGTGCGGHPCVLSQGNTQQTLSTGSNNVALVLNGVAVTAAFTAGACTGTTAACPAGSFVVGDFDGNTIAAPGIFDNGSAGGLVFTSSNPSNGTIVPTPGTTTVTTTNSFVATCVLPSVNFTVTTAIAEPTGSDTTGEFTSAELGTIGVGYPAVLSESGGTTYYCDTNAHITSSQGTITVSSLLRI